MTTVIHPIITLLIKGLIHGGREPYHTRLIIVLSDRIYCLPGGTAREEDMGGGDDDKANNDTMFHSLHYWAAASMSKLHAVSNVY